MDKTNRNVYFSHHELLELLAVTRTLRMAATSQRNKAEAKLMSELTNKLLRFHIDENGASVILDSVSRFALWSAMETYASYCSDTRQLSEYALAVVIMEKLSV